MLQRPMKEGGGRANHEHLDVEYAAEQVWYDGGSTSRHHVRRNRLCEPPTLEPLPQARLAAKAAKAAEHEERMVGAFYGRPEDKQRAWEAAQREAQQAAAARAAAVMAERQREAAWAAQPQRVVVDCERPYTAASSTYFLPPGW